MDNQIRYTVTATDILSGKLENMQVKAQGLEGTLASVGTTATSMGSKLMSGLGMLGVGFAAFKGLDLIQEGVEAVEKLHQAQAQVKAGLESTGYVAGVTAESLDKMAKSFSASTKFSRTDITDLQSLMLTFPAITKETFPQATQAILDMSTRLGQDTKSSAIQLGKALQDPISGITALRRVGVNFNDSQKDVIANLVATGQTAKAQTLILSELTTEFGGSAKAAFNADPLAEYNKKMNSMKMAMGEAGIAVMETLQPALLYLANGVKWVSEGVKNMVNWFEKHEEISKFLKVTLGAVVGMLILYKAQQKISAMYTAFTTTSMIAQAFSSAALAAGLEGASMAGMTWAGVMASVNAVMWANPVTLIVGGIALLIGVVYEVTKHFYEWGAAATLLMGPLGMLISVMMSIYSHWESIKEAFNHGGIISGIKRIGEVFSDAVLYPLQQALEWIGKLTGADWAKGASQSIKEMRKNMNLITEEETAPKKKEGLSGVAKFKAKPTGVGGEPAIAKKDKTSSVTGQKNVTINVTIGNLINDFQIKTTNIQESTQAIHDKVVMALTGAVNDSQLIAGQ